MEELSTVDRNNDRQRGDSGDPDENHLDDQEQGEELNSDDEDDHRPLSALITHTQVPSTPLEIPTSPPPLSSPIIDTATSSSFVTAANSPTMLFDDRRPLAPPPIHDQEEQNIGGEHQQHQQQQEEEQKLNEQTTD